MVAALHWGCGDDSGDSNDGAAAQQQPPAGQLPADNAQGQQAPAAGQPPAAGQQPPMMAAPVVCGTTTCPMPPDNLALTGVTACCLPDQTCGTVNMVLGGAMAACAAPVANTSMCPNEQIMGNDVPGCCVEGSNSCGVINLIAGDGSCVARDDMFLALLAPGLMPLNCDGTTPPPPAMTDPMMGAAGAAGGMGGM